MTRSSTRPDIANITKLSEYMSKPDVLVCHMTAAKHLRYLKGTQDKKLIFRKSAQPLTLIGFCDANSANSTLDRKRFTGYRFELYEQGL